MSELPDFTPDRQTARHLRSVMVAWLFGAGWLALSSGTTWIRFAEQMGLKRYAFTWGLLAAMPFVATFAQLIGSYWIERTQRRKPLFLIANVLHRSWWLVIAALPFLVLRWPNIAIISVLSMFLFQSVGAHVATPPWTSWMADIIPPRIRGRYFGIRARLSLITFVLAALVSGWLLNASRTGTLAIPYPRGVFSWALYYVPFRIATLHLCSIFFVVAAGLGIVDILYFVNIPDRPSRRLEKPPGWWDVFGPPLRNKRFVRFLIFYSVFWLGAPGIGNYIWIHVLNDLHVSDLKTQIMFMVLPPLGSMIIAPTWGYLIDHFGRKTVWMISMAFPAILPACWIFVRPEYWWIGFAIQFCGDTFWCGVDLCNFNSLLNFASGEKGSSSYQAIFAMAVAVAGTLSGLLFAGLAWLTAGFHAHIRSLPLSYVSVLFAVAALIRIGAYVFLLPAVHDDGRQPVGLALRYVFSNVYDTITSSLRLPLRVFGNGGRNGIEPDAVEPDVAATKSDLP